MNAEIPTRKTRSDCVLKNLSVEQRYAIADFAATNSIAKTRDWIAEQYKLDTGRTAVGEFLSWMKMIDKRHENKGAVHGMVTGLDTDAPLLSSEDLQHASQRHFAETIVNDSNVSAFNQAERTAVKREEVEIRRQEMQMQREEIQLQRDRLKLDQEKFQRNFVESIIESCSDPKVREVALNDKLSYGEMVAGINKIMFGDK